ncbi:MAG: hypothetical protein LBV00_12365 [Propionibacteriaceae bacterium]|jgi:hypothetical protein|nr:hypothetical protein [Propionibacteriaceae bacterium]
MQEIWDEFTTNIVASFSDNFTITWTYAVVNHYHDAGPIERIPVFLRNDQLVNWSQTQIDTSVQPQWQGPYHHRIEWDDNGVDLPQETPSWEEIYTNLLQRYGVTPQTQTDEP